MIAIGGSTMSLYRYKPFHLMNSFAGQLAVIAVDGPKPVILPEYWLKIWNGAKIRLCTDGASNSIVEPCRLNQAKKPDLIVGDFDSITEESKKFFGQFQDSELHHVSDQESTDLTKTLNKLMDKINAGYFVKSPPVGVLLLGGFTGRFDHVLGALNALLLQIQSEPNLPVFALDGLNLITVLPAGKTDIELCDEAITGICGIIPIVQRRTLVTSEGLQWELENTELEFGRLISSSNRILHPETICIWSNEPLVFTLELKDRFLL